MTALTVKNWSKFQHFKDRRPPWIKLYRDILDDVEWHALDPVAAKALVMIWLLASEAEAKDGSLPDTRTIAFRLHLSEEATEAILSRLSHWLEPTDINVTSERHQSGSPETEIETEKEVNEHTLVAGESGDGIGKVKTEIVFAKCPHQEIITLYADLLPTLPQPQIWEGSRATHLAARWRWLLADKKAKGKPFAKEDGLRWFAGLFGHVNKSDFLMGRDGKWLGCDLGWIVNANNFAKVIQGNYANKSE